MWHLSLRSPDGMASLNLYLNPGESCLILEWDDVSGLPVHRSFRERMSDLTHSCDLTEGWRVTCIKPDGDIVNVDESGSRLAPVSDRLDAFSGMIRYEKVIRFNAAPDRAVFAAENIGEVCKMEVNDVSAGVCLTPPYQFDLTGLLRGGENKIVVEVATTPARDQVNYPMAPFDFTYETVEATGMFGDVVLMYE